LRLHGEICDIKVDCECARYVGLHCTGRCTCSASEHRWDTSLNRCGMFLFSLINMKFKYNYNFKVPEIKSTDDADNGFNLDLSILENNDGF
jgi:hypothetical protein